MPDASSQLSGKSISILEMIAAGSTYEQILSAYPDFTYLDIFQAAEEALTLALRFPGSRSPSYTLSEVRERHPRAYEKWTDMEDQKLTDLVRSGATVARIAGQLERNRGAIRSRIVKLGLVAQLSRKEQDRLQRIMNRDA